MKNTICFLTLMTATAGLAGAGALDEAVRLSGPENSAAPSASIPRAPALSGDAADISPFLGYLNGLFSSPEASREPEGAILDKTAPLYSINLEEMRNRYLRPEMGFRTTRGTFVHISGTKSSNCPDNDSECDDKEKLVLVLTTSRGESYFARVMDIANASIFMSGSQDFVIDGEKYTVKVYANISSPEDSTIEVKRGGTGVFNASLARMGGALAGKGVDIRLGRTYKLAYGNEVVLAGNRPRFTGNMLVLLIPFPVSGSSYFMLKASDMARPSGVTYPRIEARHIFRITGATLEISAK